jgi:hypothetical protein
MLMNPAQQRIAVSRLKNAPFRSPTTDAALGLVRQAPSEEALAAALGDPREGPVALEVLCALRPRSEQVYEAVLRAIEHDLALSWSLIESLNRLPWYDGMRAFLSLPHSPAKYPPAYAFYILARNKVFFPTDMSGFTFDYHFNGLWALLPTARSGNWRQAHPSAFAIVELLYNHLRGLEPDTFVVYFSALMLGGIRPLGSCLRGLRSRTVERCCSRVRETAALALSLLDDEDDTDVPPGDGSATETFSDACWAVGMSASVPCDPS